MEIGRTSPRHQDLALVFPRSKDLKAYMNEYFIIVVRFCHDVLRFAQKSALRQITASLGGDKTPTFQSELRHWADQVKQEVSLLVARRVEEEAAENSLFRLASKKFSQSAAEQQKLATRLRILNECSRYDHRTAWKQIRKIGNTSTFTRCDQYKEWNNLQESRVLLYVGKLGSGKSITLANMVDDLNLSTTSSNTPVVYFFLAHDLPESLHARTIIGSLVRQLLECRKDIPEITETELRSLDTQRMVIFLRSCYGKQSKIYLVLDGLDLCPETEKKEVVKFLRQLDQEFHTSTCISLRQDPAYQVNSISGLLATARAVPLPDNSLDIVSFIHAELARCIEDRSLRLEDAALILGIRDALLEGSRGMFLWVALQIKTLCTLETDDEIVEALADLPMDLVDIYHRILEKAQGRQKMYQDRIFRLVTVAQCPLKADEIREALSVTPGDTEWNTKKSSTIHTPL
jgi:hypothetical protein